MSMHYTPLSEFMDRLYYPDGDGFNKADLGKGELLLDDFSDGLLFKNEREEYVPVTYIEKKGGGEGGGENCHTVLKLGDDFVKVAFYYYSYSGYEHDYADVCKVTPVDRVVTFYE